MARRFLGAMVLFGIASVHGAAAHDSEGTLRAEHPAGPASHHADDVPRSKTMTNNARPVLFEVFVPNASAAARVSGDAGYIVIVGDGYPDAPPGQFPNSGNPHSISRKNYQIRLPRNPRIAGYPTEVRMGAVFGVSVDGVLFDGRTAEYWRGDRQAGWNYYAFHDGCRLGLDRHNAHVQPDGTYHYHGPPKGLIETRSRGPQGEQPALIGYAADGFPIYNNRGYDRSGTRLLTLRSSYQLKRGTRPNGPGGTYSGAFVQDWEFRQGAGDLDACNGRTAATREFPRGTYHYVITPEFPAIPLCWSGSPTSALTRMHGPGGSPGAGQQGGQRRLGLTPGQPGGRRPPPPGAFGGPPPGALGGPPPMGRERGGGGRGGSRGGPCSGA